MEVAIKILKLYQEMMNKKTGGQKIETFDLIKILQGLFSIPALLVSIFLFIKFKHAFSVHTQNNIFIISCLMIT